MKTFSEAKGDTAVFTFGRFNPPTTGHEKLIDALAKQQRRNAGSLMYVYPSHSQDAKKNPLPHARKVAYMKKMFPKYAKNIIASKSRNVFEIATDLHNKGHRAIVMVVGSDRVAEFDSLLNKYNGVEGRHGYYGFDNIEVVSAGERDPDAEGVTGMSASKMRAAAVANDFDSFQQGLPRGFKDGKKLFDDIRKFMNLKEQNWTDEEIMRDAYIRGEVLNVNEEVTTESGVQGKIVRKGTNYLVLETNDGLKKVWLHEIAPIVALGKVASVARSIPPSTYAGVGTAIGQGIKKVSDYVSSKTSKKKKSTPQKAGPKGYTKKEDAPCWDTHKQVGMKKKNGKMVPNCVPKEEKIISFKEHVSKSLYDHAIMESEYQGRKVKLNDPFRLPSGSKKKFGVYVKNDKGNVVKVTFGDPNMGINRDDPEARKSFRARHQCDTNPGPKWKARYWSCYQWRAGAKVDEAQGPCWDGYEQRGMKKKGNKMVPNCVPVGEGVKQDKEIKDREGTQPAKYYAKDAEGDEMSKSTKQARARHFEKKKQ